MIEPKWIVKKVIPYSNYTLEITFADGTIKLFDAKNLLNKSIYKDFLSIDFFMTAKVECGTVVWNDDVDIAPEFLYSNSHNIYG